MPCSYCKIAWNPLDFGWYSPVSFWCWWKKTYFAWWKMMMGWLLLLFVAYIVAGWCSLALIAAYLSAGCCFLSPYWFFDWLCWSFRCAFVVLYFLHFTSSLSPDCLFDWFWLLTYLFFLLTLLLNWIYVLLTRKRTALRLFFYSKYMFSCRVG